MTSPSDLDLLFLNNEELIDAMEDCQAIADRSEAHESADEILVIALIRAANEDFTPAQTLRLIAAWRGVEKWHG